MYRGISIEFTENGGELEVQKRPREAIASLRVRVVTEVFFVATKLPGIVS